VKSNLFKVVFTGNLDDSIPVEVVKKKLALLFNKNLDKIDSFFKGTSFTVKQNINRQTSEKYCEALKKAGAICEIKSEEENLNKDFHKIITLDLRNTDPKLSLRPLICNLMTGTSEGIRINRIEKDEIKFSEIQSVSVCTQTGDIMGLQVLFFIKDLIRPVSVKPGNIRFADFLNNTTLLTKDSVKQFLNDLFKKCPALILDKATYEFVFLEYGQLPKAEPNCVSTAMNKMLDHALHRSPDPAATLSTKNRDLQKVDTKSPVAAYKENKYQSHAEKDNQSSRINLRALFQMKYLIWIVAVTITLGLGYHFYNVSKDQNAYLRFNESLCYKFKKQYAKERMEIIFEHKFFRAEESAGCQIAELDVFIDSMLSADSLDYKQIASCANRFDKSVEIIKPFFQWYNSQDEENLPYSIRELSDVITTMRDKAIGPLREIFQTTDNEKIMQYCAAILSGIGSQEALDILVAAINDNSSLQADWAAREIKAIVSSGSYELANAFELVKKVYEFDDPKIRSIAIKTLLLFEGSGPGDLAIKGINDADEKVKRNAQEVLKKLTP